MAKALLVSRQDVVRFTNMNGGISTDDFIQFVSIAQDIHIQSMLGTKLLEKLQADIIAGTLANPYKRFIRNLHKTKFNPRKYVGILANGCYNDRGKRGI